MNKNHLKFMLTVGLVALLLICLPLLGVWLDGKQIRPYLAFPWSTAHASWTYVPAPPFSWAVFILLGTLIFVVLAPFLLQLFRFQRHIKQYLPPSPGKLPWWGRAALLLFFLSWGLAWSRFSWFEHFQDNTFTPLWLSYILVINAFTHKRSGRCMLTHAPVYLVALFVASPFFWWFFEYLNRFAGNWNYYESPGELHALNISATTAFSTVLPGVASTCDLLSTFPRIRAGMNRFITFDPGNHPTVPWLLLLLSSAALAGIGVWPDLLFPTLWVSPLLLIVSIQTIAGYATIFTPLKTGDWTHLWLMTVSALVCGFFWELWNFFSLAHWEYAVPYVGRFHIFEMPVLGYAGYLPFGLECAVISDCVRRVLQRKHR